MREGRLPGDRAARKDALMGYQPQATAAAPSQDRSTLVLLIVIVLLVAGGAGWLIARASTPGWGDVETYGQMAQREGALEGRRAGYRQGAESGRRESRLRTQLNSLKQQQAARTEGWNRGFQDARERSQARADGYDIFPAGMGSDAYPAAGYEDIELSLGELFTDTPGYVSSALSGTGAYDTPASDMVRPGGSLNSLYGSGSGY
jgi:hypothetical protein